MLIFLRKKSNFAKKVGKFVNRVYNTISECDGEKFFCTEIFPCAILIMNRKNSGRIDTERI